MSRVQHMEQQITALEPGELRALREWFAQYDGDQDHEAGRSTDL